MIWYIDRESEKEEKGRSYSTRRQTLSNPCLPLTAHRAARRVDRRKTAK